MEKLIAAAILLVIGGCMLLCTGAMIRFQIWSQRTIAGAQYIPSKRTYTLMRIVGAFLVLIAALVAIL